MDLLSGNRRKVIAFSTARVRSRLAPLGHSAVVSSVSWFGPLPAALVAVLFLNRRYKMERSSSYG